MLLARKEEHGEIVSASSATGSRTRCALLRDEHATSS
jgi:hypothetical protein